MLTALARIQYYGKKGMTLQDVDQVRRQVEAIYLIATMACRDETDKEWPYGLPLQEGLSIDQESLQQL